MTGIGCSRTAARVRRSTLEIRVRFEPSRLAREDLRTAYEQVTPLRRRQVRTPGVKTKDTAVQVQDRLVEVVAS